MTQRERELFVYDGQDRLGRIDVAADGKAQAFDRRGTLLGTFPTFKAASAALNPTVEPRAAAVPPLASAK